MDGLGPVVNVSCPYGVFNRGDLAMLLDYSGKYVRYSGDALPNKPADGLSLDMIPSFENGQLKVGVYFKGMPLPDAEVSLVRIDAESFKTNSDDTGNAVCQKYSEKRYYCTMVLDLGGDLSVSKVPATENAVQKNVSDAKLERVDAQIEDFPRGMTSFGATVLGNKLFVTGGKSGRAHSYARAVWKLVTKKAKSTNCGPLRTLRPSTQKPKNGLSGHHCLKADHRLMLVFTKTKFMSSVVGRWRAEKTLNGHRTCWCWTQALTNQNGSVSKCHSKTAR